VGGFLERAWIESLEVEEEQRLVQQQLWKMKCGWLSAGASGDSTPFPIKTWLLDRMVELAGS